jgi:hypothetical protein
VPLDAAWATDTPPIATIQTLQTANRLRFFNECMSQSFPLLVVCFNCCRVDRQNTRVSRVVVQKVFLVEVSIRDTNARLSPIRVILFDAFLDELSLLLSGINHPLQIENFLHPQRDERNFVALFFSTQMQPNKILPLARNVI